jgi:hypothetical protein
MKLQNTFKLITKKEKKMKKTRAASLSRKPENPPFQGLSGCLVASVIMDTCAARSDRCRSSSVTGYEISSSRSSFATKITFVGVEGAAMTA